MEYAKNYDFTDKTVLVTGGGGSIGSEIARAFLSCGAHVCLADISKDNLKSTLAELNVGERAKGVICDVRNIASIEAMAKEVQSWHGRIDVLVNHAGLSIRKPAEDFTEQDWDTVMDINLKGVFFVAQAVGRIMIKQKAGKIINTGSVSSTRGRATLSAYAASKGGVVQITKVLANEWAQHNINVNAIGPGYTITKQTQGYMTDQKVYSAFIEKVPMKRLGTTQDMANGVLFLASEGSSYITGHTLYIEGGRLIE